MKFNFSALLLLLSLAIVGTSCKKNSDEIAITGKWIVKGSETHEFYSGTSHYSSDTPSSGAYIELKADGTLYAVSTASFSSGTWNKNGDKLNLTSTIGGSEIWTIKKLTASELVLYWTDKDQYPADYAEVNVYLGR